MMAEKTPKTEHELEIEIIKHQDEMRCLEAENKERKPEIAKIKAEAARLEANSKLLELQRELLCRIINELDQSNITPQQAFILIKALKPSAGKDSDLSARLSNIEDQLEKFKAETKNIKAG